MNINIPELSEVINRVNLLEKAFAEIKFPQTPAKEYYSIKDAAEYLNISEKSVRRKISQKTIKANRQLRHIRIAREELERYGKYGY